MSILDSTYRTLDFAAKQSDTALLFWSATGKDSIALLDMCRKRFKKVICLYMYLLPDLDVINPYIKWAESFDNVEVVQTRHPDYYEYMNAGLFQVRTKKKKYRVLKRAMIEEYYTKLYDTNVNIWGYKLKDSYVRRGMLHRAANNTIHYDYNKFYPIVNWSNKEVLSYIKINKLPPPLSLGMKGTASTGISLSEDVMIYLRENYNRDYQKFMKVFPLFEINIKNYEQKQREKQISKEQSSKDAQKRNKKSSLQSKKDI